GHFLALLNLFHGGDQIAQAGGFFESERVGGDVHTSAKAAGEVGVPAFEEEADVADGGGVCFVGGQALHARSQAAVNVELEARLGVKAGEIDLAGGDLKVPVNEVDQAVGEVGGKIRTEI